MRSLAKRLRFHAATDKAFDLKMAASLWNIRLAWPRKLARPATAPLHSGGLP
jgi:hypothetical protein